jgi:thiamine biosynthesis lipoprotein ApbE
VSSQLVIDTAQSDELHVQPDGGTTVLVEGDMERVDRRRALATLYGLAARWRAADGTSEIAKLNAAGGAPVVVSAETGRLIATAITASRWTAGAFAPVPDDVEVLNADAGMAIVRVPPGVHLDLRRFDAGVAVDLAIEQLWRGSRDGARRRCVALDHVVRVSSPLDEQPWHITLQSGESGFSLTVPTGAVAVQGSLVVVATEGWRATALAIAAQGRTGAEISRLLRTRGATGAILEADRPPVWLAGLERFVRQRV